MQERQIPPFENQTTAERAAIRRVRRRRALGWVTTIGVGALALFAVGCPEPGDLANPNDFPAPTGSSGSGSMAGSSTGGGSTGGGSTAGSSSGGPIAACEVDCVKTIFKDQCQICHGTLTKLSGTLDLETAGFSARLKDHAAEHMGSTPGPCPTGDKLIDSATPANSWLLKKVTDMQGTCGTVMPAPTALPAADLTCLTTYVNCVAGGT